MKAPLLTTVFAFVGLLTGVVVGALNTGLVPLCGDPCGTERLGQSTIWGLSLMLAFPIVGGFVLKKMGSRSPRIVVLVFAMASAALIPATSIYGFKLHRIYWQSTAVLGVPDVDYSYMSIATKPIIAMDGLVHVQIKAWERCALGPVVCDKSPRTVQAMCLGVRKVVTIQESGWSSFQRIPDEDLQGLTDSPKDMHLCAVP